MRSVSVVSALVILSGCASTSEIVSYGKDSYLLNVEDITGVHSPGKLQVKAAQDASAYCAKQGKVMRVRNTPATDFARREGTSSSLVFSCIAENDPENTRPPLRKEPDVVIERRN